MNSKILFRNQFEIKRFKPINFIFVGDGGNDVSMIQAADAGIGIVGKVRQYFLKYFRPKYWVHF